MLSFPRRWFGGRNISREIVGLAADEAISEARKINEAITVLKRSSDPIADLVRNMRHMQNGKITLT